MNREDVYKLIDGERDYQDQKWNEKVTDTPQHHSPEEWIMYMQDYLQEAAHILSREPANIAYPVAMEIVRKVVGLGFAAMEQWETKPREK